MHSDLHETAKVTGLHPAIVFIGMMVAVLFTDQAPIPIQVPVFIIQVFQIVAYICTSLVGIVAFLKYWHSDLKHRLKFVKKRKK